MYNCLETMTVCHMRQCLVAWWMSMTRGKRDCQGCGATHNPHLNGISGKRYRSFSKQRQEDVKLWISWSMGGGCILVLTFATAAGPGPLTPMARRPHLAATDISKAVLVLWP